MVLDFSNVTCRPITRERVNKHYFPWRWVLFFIASGAWLSPLYCGHFWPIVPATDDRWGWLWSTWWNEDWKGKLKYSENTCPALLRPPQIPLYQTPDRTRAAAMGSQRLTAWAMERPEMGSWYPACKHPVTLLRVYLKLFMYYTARQQCNKFFLLSSTFTFTFEATCFGPKCPSSGVLKCYE
jgi:hypothetical protein